ncbi:MAG: helicase HerA-like domain-containing protein [Acidimicrobiales bacterium]
MADFLLGGQIDPATKQRNETNTLVASGDLTTHGVIVGMTGSGKTGLGIVLIEEALRAGVPALLIDPKGDLTNLCLTFPNLAPADFEPWVNEGDAAKAGQSVHDFASAQADAWRTGLEGWGLGGAAIAELRSKVEFTIYTPGSAGGVGVNIVGSLQAPPDMADHETVGDEIEGYVSGLLGLVGIEADPLSSREHILLSNLILNEWTQGRSLDLPTLVGMALTPPIRKLGVFELDSFFPPKDRTAFAMRLNGLLASPSFGAWMSGQPLDMDTLLHTPDGRPRCAIVTTAHLSDEERQFVTTLVLSKLITWMRRQSGTTDLRALLYMDEVAGYLPPTAAPPTKKPIMTLMKQARAFGVGVVLSTQNPVDIDYKALSNAGTWMIGRLQTDRDKMRLLDGMSAASGGVDVAAVSDTISGLGKRQFVLKRAGKDQPELFTTRWAMSYLRGPLTRDQIASLMADHKAATAETAPVAPAAPAAAPTAGGFAPPSGPAMPAPTAPLPASPALDPDATALAPKVADGVPVRWIDVAAPWLAAAGGDPRGTRLQAAAVARIAARFDDETADLVHDEEYELVLTPLPELLDVSLAAAVDHDERDLRTEAPVGVTYVLPGSKIGTKTFWTKLQRDLVDQLVRSRQLELLANRELRLVARPGETPEAFATRCATTADERADAEIAKLKDGYETRFNRLREQLRTAENRADVLKEEREGKRNEEVLSTVGSVLGGIFGGRRRGGVFGSINKAATKRRQSSTAGARLDAAQDKVQSLSDQLIELQGDLENEVTEIDVRWAAVAKQIETVTVPLEKNDVKVTQLVLGWMPVP